MAKRVNKRFLVILTAVVAVVGVTAMAAMYVGPRFFKKNPQQLVAESQRLEKEGNIDQAIAAYGSAVTADPRNPELRVGLGDLLDRQAVRDPLNIQKARQQWHDALAIDPGYKPAAERLLEHFWEVQKVEPRAEAFTATTEAAKRVLAGEPNNIKAKSRLHMITIRSVLADIPVRNADVQASVKALRDMAKQNPKDAELPFYAIQGEMYLAQQAIKRVTDVSEARETVDRLEAEIAQLLEDNPTHAHMQFQGAQLYWMMVPLDEATSRLRRPTSGPSAGGATTRPGAATAVAAAGGRYRDRIDAAFEAANKHAKHTDSFYVDLQYIRFNWLRAVGKREEAEKVIENLAATHADVEPAVRLQYARFFRSVPERMPKIMEMLERPVKLDGFTGVEGARRMEMKTDLAFELAILRLATVENEPDPAKRKAVIDQVNSTAKQLEVHTFRQIQLLDLKGRVAIARRQYHEAIPLLQKSIDLSKQSPNYDTMRVLADAYLKTGQTGMSEKLLRQLASLVPEMAPTWIRVLWQNGQLDEAREQIAELKKRDPKHPGIPALEAMVEGGDKLTAYVEKMPEKTTTDRVAKAAMLLSEGKKDEAVELAQSVFKEDPKNYDALRLLLQIYTTSDRRDEAIELANEAIKANPENQQLKKLPDQLAKRTPEEAEKWVLEQINEDTEPLRRELKMYQFYVNKIVAAEQRGDKEGVKKNLAEADKHLSAAEKIKPDDVAVMGVRFQFLLTQRNFDAAQALLQRLAAVNADQVNGQWLRYRLAMAKNDPVAAETAARDLSRQQPNFAIGWQLLGAAMQAQGRHRDAVSAYEAAIERQGKNYEALRGLIQAYYALEETGEAKSVLDRARAAFPDDVPLREMWLNHELAYGDPAKTLAERERILKQEPDVPTNSLVLAETYLRVASQTRDQAEAKRIVAKARTVLEAGLKKWPADARFQWPIAQVMQAQGDFAGGEKLLKAYAARPEVAATGEGERLLAEYYDRANKPKEAEAALRAALKKSPESVTIKRTLAGLLATNGRLDEAIKEIEGVPGPDAARQRYQFYMGAKKPKEAEQVLRDGIKANPASQELSNVLIEMLIGQRRLDEADQLVKARLAANDLDETARYLGALTKLNRPTPDYSGAIKDLTAIVNRNPRAVSVISLLAEAQHAAEDVDGAIERIQRAVELSPANRELRVRLIDWASAQGRWELVANVASTAAAQPRLSRDPAWPLALAKAHAARGKFPEAEKAIVQAMALTPPEQRAAMERDHLAIIYQAGALPNLKKRTDDLIAKKRKDWWIYQYRAMAKAGMKDKTAANDFDTALAALKPDANFGEAQGVVRAISSTLGPDEALKRAAKWEQQHPRWRLVSAELMLTKGDLGKALEHLKPLEADIEALPKDLQASVYRTLAMLYQSLKPRPDVNSAIAAYKKYLALQPRDVLVLNNLAYLLAEELDPPNPQEAKVYSKQAYDVVREWRAGEAKGRVYDTHGWVLVLNKGPDLDAGIKILREVVDEFPLAEAHYHLGMAQIEKKRADDAEEQLRQAQSMIEQMKKDKKDVDEALERRIERGLKQVKTIRPAAAAAER